MSGNVKVFVKNAKIETAKKKRRFPPYRESLGPLVSYNFPKKGAEKAPNIVPGSSAKPAAEVASCFTKTKKLGIRKLADKFENWQRKKGIIPSKITGFFKIRISKKGCSTVKLRQTKRTSDNKKMMTKVQLKLPSSKLEIIMIEKVSESVRSKKEIHSKGRFCLLGVFSKKKNPRMNEMIETGMMNV